MKNLHTKKTSNGSNFGWLIQQMSINQKSGRQTFCRRFVSGSLFVSPCPPECYLQSETKTEPDLRLHNFHKKRKEVCMKTRSTSASPCLHSESDMRILVRKFKKKGMTLFKRGKNIRWVIGKDEVRTHVVIIIIVVFRS